jgi:hypothetical protein
MGALTLYFAADILRELRSILKEELFNLDEPNTVSADLMTGAIDLTRAAIMSLSNETSLGWKLTLTKAAFWCLQAEECRRAWEGDFRNDRYHDEDRWEEHRIY